MAALKPADAPIMRELPPDKRRPTHVLIKGNFLSRASRSRRPSPPRSTRCRRTRRRTGWALAQWLVDQENPLTARVAVNRFWAQLFGTGLVETQEDFGTQGQPPSHPELLDWLAVEFMERRARLGHEGDCCRLIVTSATYRQSSKVTPGSAGEGPAQPLLARCPRPRLEAERCATRRWRSAGC